MTSRLWTTVCGANTHFYNPHLNHSSDNYDIWTALCFISLCETTGVSVMFEDEEKKKKTAQWNGDAMPRISIKGMRCFSLGWEGCNRWHRWAAWCTFYNPAVLWDGDAVLVSMYVTILSRVRGMAQMTKMNSSMHLQFQSLQHFYKIVMLCWWVCQWQSCPR